MAAALPIPTTLVQALILMVKRTLYHAILPHRVLFLATLTAALALAHTYLLVAVNEGFNLSNPWMSEILVLPRRLVRGTSMYLATGFLGASVLRRAVFHPVQFPQDLAGLPLTVIRAVRAARATALGLIPAAAALGMFLGTLAQQRILQVEAAVILLLSASLHDRSFSAALLRLGAQDAARLTQLPIPAFRIEWLILPATGGAIGLTLASVLPWMPWTGAVLSLGLGALTLVGSGVALVRRAPGVAIALLALGLILAQPALADDGGWIEGGGSFERWIWSDGAWLSIGIGLIPGFSAGIGWVIGVVVGDLDPSDWGLPPAIEPEPQENAVEVQVRIERIFPDSPHVLSRGWRYRADVEILSGPEGLAVSAVHWSGDRCLFGSPVSGVRQWNAVDFVGAGPAAVTVWVEVEGQRFEATTTDTVENAYGYARIGDNASCPACTHGCDACPHKTIGPIVTGFSGFLLNGQPIARVGDTGVAGVCCGTNTFEIVEGNPQILIGGIPAAKVGCKTKHCGGMGKIVSGYGESIE